MYCLMCDKGNFEIYTGINRELVEVNGERLDRGYPRGFGDNSSKGILNKL